MKKTNKQTNKQTKTKTNSGHWHLPEGTPSIE